MVREQQSGAASHVYAHALMLTQLQRLAPLYVKACTDAGLQLHAGVTQWHDPECGPQAHSCPLRACSALVELPERRAEHWKKTWPQELDHPGAAAVAVAEIFAAIGDAAAAVLAGQMQSVIWHGPEKGFESRSLCQMVHVSLLSVDTA
jgi:hypothetical protein